MKYKGFEIKVWRVRSNLYRWQVETPDGEYVLKTKGGYTVALLGKATNKRQGILHGKLNIDMYLGFIPDKIRMYKIILSLDMYKNQNSVYASKIYEDKLKQFKEKYPDVDINNYL